MGDAHIDHRFVPCHVIGAIRDRFAHTLTREIVDVHRLRCALRLPPPTAILEASDQFLFLRIHTDYRVMVADKVPDLLVEVAELCVCLDRGAGCPRSSSRWPAGSSPVPGGSAPR